MEHTQLSCMNYKHMEYSPIQRLPLTCAKIWLSEYRRNNVNEVKHVQFDITLTKNKQQSTRQGETLRGNWQKL
jgi:hypothetical protein